MTKIYSNIFLIDNSQEGSQLSNILKRNYFEPLEHTKNDQGKIDAMNKNERNFIYSWSYISEPEEITLPKVADDSDNSSNSQTITFKKAIAGIEYGKRKKKDENGNFLPKNERLNYIEITTIFFKLSNKLYVLILTSNSYHTDRVKKLIGLNNLEDSNPNFHIDPDMFNWLFYKYIDLKGDISTNLRLENITGFIGNVLDDANIFEGQSEQTTKLVVTKAFISNGGELTRVTLRLRRENEADVTFAITNSSTIVINCNNSMKLKILDSLDDETFFLLYIYGYLIMELKHLYRKESKLFKETKSITFSREIGLEVIKSIIKKNKISFKAVQNFFLNCQIKCNTKNLFLEVV